MLVHYYEIFLGVYLEAQDMAKQRSELERAKEIAAEIAQEVEDGKHELELQRNAFEHDMKNIHAFGIQVI
jgi:hypothetical protein